MADQDAKQEKPVKRDPRVRLDIDNKCVVVMGPMSAYKLSFDDLSLERVHVVMEALDAAYSAGVHRGAATVRTGADHACHTIMRAEGSG